MLVLRRGKTTHIAELMGIKGQCGLVIALLPDSENSRKMSGCDCNRFKFPLIAETSPTLTTLIAYYWMHPAPVWELYTVMLMPAGYGRQSSLSRNSVLQAEPY